MRTGKERRLRRQIRELKQAQSKKSREANQLAGNTRETPSGRQPIKFAVATDVEIKPKKPDNLLRGFMSRRVSLDELKAAGYPIKREKV